MLKMIGRLVFASLCLTALPLAAQSTYGTPLGTVQDSTGAVMAGAEIT